MELETERFEDIGKLWIHDVRRTRRAETVQSDEIALQKFKECAPDVETRLITRADPMKFCDWRVDTTSVLPANQP